MLGRHKAYHVIRNKEIACLAMLSRGHRLMNAYELGSTEKYWLAGSNL
jgi:hypothetical protein